MYLIIERSIISMFFILYLFIYLILYTFYLFYISLFILEQWRKKHWYYLMDSIEFSKISLLINISFICTYIYFYFFYHVLCYIFSYLLRYLFFFWNYLCFFILLWIFYSNLDIIWIKYLENYYLYDMSSYSTKFCFPVIIR